MTAPTEAVSGMIDGTAHPLGAAPDGVFMDPEAAVGAALQATHDGPELIEQRTPGQQSVRELGRHMLGLLGADDASEQQRLGARIILMQGTPTEQKLLFLHDAIDVAGQLSRNEGVTPAEAVRDFDSAHALFEHDNAPSSVRDLVFKSQRGEDVRSRDIEAAVADVLAETLPRLPADECVALLRRARAVEGGDLPLHELKDPKAFTALIEKVPEVSDGYDKALLVDTVITGAKKAHQRAGHEAAAQSGRRKARHDTDEAMRTYEAIEGQAYAALPEEVAHFCTQSDGRVYASELRKIIEIGERGVTFDSLTKLDSFDRDFMWYYQHGNIQAEPEVLNRIAALVSSEDDKGQALVRAVTDDYYAADKKLEALGAVDTLARQEGLEGIVDSPRAAASMVGIFMGHGAEERPAVLEKWHDMAKTIDIGKAMRVFRNREDFAALQSLVERGDQEAIRDLQRLLGIPGIVDEWEQGGLSFYSGSEKDLKAVFTDPHYSTVNWQAAKRRLVADKISDPEIAPLADDPTLRLGIKQWVSSTLNINNHAELDERGARMDRYASFVRLPGVGEAMSGIGQNNPAAFEDLWLLELTDDQPHELLAEKMRTLAGMPADCVDAQLMHALGRPSEAFDSLVTLQNYGMLARMQDTPILNRTKGSFAHWFMDEGSGTHVEKSVILSDPEFQGQLEKLDGSFIAEMAPRSLYGVPAASLRAHTADLVSVADNEQVAAFFAGTKIARTYQGDMIIDALLKADDTAATAAKVGEVYRDNQELLLSLAELDFNLPGAVALRWAADGDNTYLEEWKRVTSGNDMFWQFISPNGAGYGLRTQLMNSLSTTHSPENLVQSMTSLLTRERPLWLINTEIAKWAIQEKGYHEGMMVEEIPVGLPGSQKLDGPSTQQLLQGDLLVALRDMDIETKRMWLNAEGMTDEEVANINRISFGMLQPEAQQASMAYRLFETIETSRSEELRQQATDRNTAFAVSGQTIWQEGMLTHFTTPDGLRPTLVSGNIAGEMIGLKSKADSYPFNVDLVVANDEVLSRQSHIEKVQALASSHFGPVAMHYRRGPGAFRRGEEFEVPGNYRGQHRLLFGGIPATELSAVSVQSDEIVGELKTTFVQAGLYVPIYDTSGQLAFTPHEYQAMREDGNYNRVKPEIVDGAFMREGSQAGSNEGAEMYLPNGQGDPQRWYTKFAQGVEADHLWTEILTDSAYRLVEPDLVPETKAVIMDGRFARASKMVEPSGEVTDRGRNRGFILDAWTGNWDAVFNPDNLVPYGPETALRIDTGNSMDFKAKGGKKGFDTPPFGDEVTELAEGTDRQKLYNGMRQMYPGLTDDDIREQVAHLRERATDAAIDSLVDNVRRSRNDREYLKRTLKARRDYIINYFASL